MIRVEDEDPRVVIFSSSGHKIISGWSDCEIRIYDVATGEMSQNPLTGHTDWIWCLACSSNDERIISSSADGTIRIWNAEPGEIVRELSRGSEWITCVAFSPDEKHIVSGSSEGTVSIWSVDTGDVNHYKEFNTCICSIAFTPNGGQVISVSEEGIHIWDRNWEGLGVSRLLSADVKLLMYLFIPNSDLISHDGQLIVFPDDQTIIFYDVATGNWLDESLGPYRSDLTSITFSSDDKLLACEFHAILEVFLVLQNRQEFFGNTEELILVFK